MNTIDFDKLSSYPTPEESPGFLLWCVSTRWRSAIEDVLKPLDLTHPQFVILATTAWLIREKGQMSQVEIGRHAGLDPNTTSQILRGLEAKNLIERRRSLDERSKNPILTIEGAQSLAQALPAVERADAQFFASLTREESYALVNVFQKLVFKKCESTIKPL